MVLFWFLISGSVRNKYSNLSWTSSGGCSLFFSVIVILLIALESLCSCTLQAACVAGDSLELLIWVCTPLFAQSWRWLVQLNFVFVCFISILHFSLGGGDTWDGMWIALLSVFYRFLHLFVCLCLISAFFPSNLSLLAWECFYSLLSPLQLIRLFLVGFGWQEMWVRLF